MRLWLGQFTEKEIGVPYDVLDLIVYAYCKGLSPEKIASETRLDLGVVTMIVSSDQGK